MMFSESYNGLWQGLVLAALQLVTLRLFLVSAINNQGSRTFVAGLLHYGLFLGLAVYWIWDLLKENHSPWFFAASYSLSLFAGLIVGFAYSQVNDRRLKYTKDQATQGD